jgi:hypothetical protein
MAGMKFANIQDIPGYSPLLKENGWTVVAADDTGRFAAHFDLYLSMVDMQLTYDALKIIGFNMDMLQAVTSGFAFMRDLAHAGKLAQGRVRAHYPIAESRFLQRYGGASGRGFIIGKRLLETAVVGSEPGRGVRDSRVGERYCFKLGGIQWQSTRARLSPRWRRYGA